MSFVINIQNYTSLATGRRGDTLEMGRLMFPWVVLMRSTGTRLFGPEKAFRMRPNFHLMGWNRSWTITKSPSCRLTRGVVYCYFGRCWKYSCDYLHQNRLFAFSIKHHREFNVRIRVFGDSGMSRRGAPIKKWSGVKARGSEDIGLKGLEFIQLSIWHSKLVNSLKFSTLDLQVFNRLFSIYFIAAFHRPPTFFAYGGMKCQLKF